MQKTKLFKVLSAIIFISLIALPLFSNLKERRPHGDERLWIDSTAYYQLLFIEQDFKNRRWRDKQSLDQPLLGSYLIGASLQLAGHQNIEKRLKKHKPWNFDRSTPWNVRHKRLPPMKLLLPPRLMMAAFGALAALLAFGIGALTHSKITGIIAAFLIAYNPLFLRCSQRGMPDAPLIFFMLAVFALTLLFFKALSKARIRSALLHALAIGVCIGLAASVKLTGVATGIFFAALCLSLIAFKLCSLILAFKQRNTPLFRALYTEIAVLFLSGLLAGFISIMVFTGLNPQLYERPVSKTFDMLFYRSDLMQGQQDTSPKLALRSLPERANRVTKRVLLNGNYNFTLLGKLSSIPADLILFVIGIVLLLWKETGNVYRQGSPSEKTVLLYWMGISGLCIVAFIPLDWDRYYLPLIPGIAFVMAYACSQFLTFLFFFLRKSYVLVSGHSGS